MIALNSLSMTSAGQQGYYPKWMHKWATTEFIQFRSLLGTFSARSDFPIITFRKCCRRYLFHHGNGWNLSSHLWWSQNNLVQILQKIKSTSWHKKEFIVFEIMIFKNNIEEFYFFSSPGQQSLKKLIFTDLLPSNSLLFVRMIILLLTIMKKTLILETSVWSEISTNGLYLE